MASGRPRGYRDDEFKGRESDCDLSGEDSAFWKQRHDRIENGSMESDSGRVRVCELKNVVNSRARQREVVNGGTRRALSKSDSGSSGNERRGALQQCDFAAKAVDREPGELSSDSGSVGAIEMESQVKNDSVTSKEVENGMIKAPVEKKRKFSPIVWDRDSKKVNNSSKASVSHHVVTSPPPRPSMRKQKHEVVDVTVEETVGISAIRNLRNQNMGSSSSIEDPVAKSLAEPESLPEGHQLDKNLKPEDPEVKGYASTRHISSSRWASGNHSPVDECEIVGDEEICKMRKNVPKFDSSGSRMQSKSVTPEGDLKREGSEGSKCPTSNDTRFHAGSSSEDGHPNDGSERAGCMEADVDHRYSNRSIGHSDTDFEDGNGSRGTPEPAGPPQRSVNMLRGCRSVDEFERLNKIDEGTYGVVYRAKDRITGEILALKKVVVLIAFLW
ncbi:Cyclin-dependent kinase G-2 [Linum grandiflorum]